jgi:2-polyprenyl-3-methyl-5-hydroxy-6-metoxy-1,4-benzoquinol methylase
MFLPPSDAEGAQREVLETIRRHLGTGASQAERSSEDATVDLSRLRESARQLSLTHALVGRMPPQTSTFRGRVGAWIIRKIQRALFWYTPQILEFHRSVDHVVEELVKVVEELLREQIQTRALVADQIANFRTEMAGREEAVRLEVRRVEQDMCRLLEQEAVAREAVAANSWERVKAVEGRLGDTERRISSMRRGLVSQEMRLSMLFEQDRKRLDPVGDGQLAVTVPEDLHKMDATHLTFQDQFRSTREDIKERLHIYLPILKSHGIGSPEMPLLDVGCGRGEWLEILRQEGVCARGVDSNRALIEECRTRKLQAVESDAIAYLRSLDAESLGGVMGFYLIEHLPFPALMDLLDETVRVLKPGGLAVFETPNPGNVLVSIQKFHYEETPRQPLPSPLIRSLAEERGLCRVEILELRPSPEAVRVPEHDGAVVERFNQLFYGPQDYAIIGWKA